MCQRYHKRHLIPRESSKSPKQSQKKVKTLNETSANDLAGVAPREERASRKELQHRGLSSKRKQVAF